MQPIEHRIVTPATARTAYDAVATDAGIKGWWAKVGAVAEDVGGTVELHFTKEDRNVTMTFRVDALQPERLVRWVCTDNGNPVWKGSTLTWTIDDRGNDRLVRFAHAGFAGGGPPYDMTVDGWKVFMKSLEGYLAGRGGTPSD